MSSVVTLEHLLDTRQAWRGNIAIPTYGPPTGHAALDAVLPGGGWPESALNEILTACPGIGELRLLWPTLARLTSRGERTILVSPPHIPYPQAWLAAGVDLRYLTLIQAEGHDALWATEQCLRSGSCGAVLCWPTRTNDRILRRLQVAAHTGQTLGFIYRPLHEAVNPSPAALRLAVEAQPARLRVLKCRGGHVPAKPIPINLWQ